VGSALPQLTQHLRRLQRSLQRRARLALLLKIRQESACLSDSRWVGSSFSDIGMLGIALSEFMLAT
jgi:hypothetical protein